MADQSIFDHGRRYISDVLRGMDTSDLEDDLVIELVDKHYISGWKGFSKFWSEIPGTTKPAAQLTDKQRFLQLRERVTSQLHPGGIWHLGQYDEVLCYTEKADVTQVCLCVATVEERSRQDVIVSTVTRFITVDHTSGKYDYKDYADPEPQLSTTHRWGRLRDAERVESDSWQLETCYRPGTSKTPMKGWIARLELSWEQAHEWDMPKLPEEDEK